ncbi:MAG: hypothetical protein AB8B95_03230 [Pseudohongiellaceae bacterium]
MNDDFSSVADESRFKTPRDGIYRVPTCAYGNLAAICFGGSYYQVIF